MYPPISIAESLRLAGNHLLAILNPEENYLPYWELTVEPDYTAALKRWWPAHNIGRWWDAMTRLEAATGFQIPAHIDAAMQENMRRFFDNPDHISLNPDPFPTWTKERNLPPQLQWDLHSLREGMLALNALARYRNSAWAADMGRKLVQSLDAKLRDDGTWDAEKFDAYQKRGDRVIHNYAPSDTHGRMLEALVWFYETTGDVEVLRFADRVARWHFANTTPPDGSLPDSARADHTHSYFGTLRGLLLYGKLSRQREYIERVAAAYRVSVNRVVHDSGYTSHNMVEESFGETTSPGDAAQIALWLALEGYSEFLDDADRLIRSRVLPSQILDTPPLTPIPIFGVNANTNLEQRIIGGYGGCHFHPHAGKQAVTDVTAADVHTLVDIYQHLAVARNGILDIFFHLDYEDDRVKVECRRLERGELTVTLKQETTIGIRVPQWTPLSNVQFQAGEQPLEPVYAGHFARAGRLPTGVQITMRYDLAQRQTKETGLGGEYEIFWKGDDVVAVSPNSDFYPFYPSAAGAQV